MAARDPLPLGRISERGSFTSKVPLARPVYLLDFHDPRLHFYVDTPFSFFASISSDTNCRLCDSFTEEFEKEIDNPFNSSRFRFSLVNESTRTNLATVTRTIQRHNEGLSPADGARLDGASAAPVH